MKIKDLTLIAILAAILFIQETALSFIPNVQFTVLFLVLYSKLLSFKKTALIVIIHVTLDNLLWGMQLPYYLSMLVGWLLIPLVLSTLGRKLKSPLALAIFGAAMSFVYCWALIPAGMLLRGLPFVAYFLADLSFEVILAASSFISILWLYEPLYKRLEQILKTYFQQ